jgi:hypothetical protein
MSHQRSLDELLFHWRAVIGAAPKGWARNFALSIQKASRKPDWHPSAKQLPLMQRMVSDLFTQRDPAEDEDDLELIEDAA